MLQNIGLSELIIIILILTVFFGSKKITEFAKQAGKATHELKKIKSEYNETIEEIKKEPTIKEAKPKKRGGVKV